MKKTLLLIASAVLLLVGCAKEILGPEAGADEMVTASFTAQMQGMPQTKSLTDGEGTKANRCVMEIYYKGLLYTRDVQPISNMTATFTPRLVSNRTYDVLFWADCGEDLADKYYTTNAEGLGLQAVEMKSTSYAANDDARDAFFSHEENVVVGKQVSSETFTLTRPFAQVNIITTDAAIIKNDNLYPDGVKMVYNAPTKFNLLTKELNNAKTITVTGTPYEPFDKTSSALTLEMDYLFTGTEESVLDIAFEASKTGELTVISHSFSNIPVQRNFRTNIKGALLTTTGTWTATIYPIWNQPDKKVVEAGSVAAANEAFANGATNVKITSVGEETTLFLPVLTDEVTIDFANPDKVVTVKYGPAPDASPATKAAVADNPAVVNIATNDVTKFVATGINNLVWLAGNQAALANALTNATNTQVVALANDIAMSGEWTPVTSAKNNDGNHYYGTFDGRNHVISNLKITDYIGDYAGFFSHVAGATIKNVTFKNATVTNAASNEGGRGAVIVGWSYACVIDNCHVINSSVIGGQKVGGILGCISVEGASNLNKVTNCSVEGLTLGSNIPDDILYQAGALVGYIQLVAKNPNGVLIENNSVKDITINDAFDGPDNEAWYCGTFIGSIIRKQKIDGQKIILNKNTISGKNTEVFKTIYSSPYFGWATNAENYADAIAPIVIDGEEWTPNYPVKNVTKGIAYPTLAEAVTAASADDKINITAAGTYTVPAISMNVTIAGAAEGDVVFDCTGSGSIASIPNGAKFQNVTMNFGQNTYHGFQGAKHIVMEQSTLNGLFFSYGDMTFNYCTFNQEEEEYNMWAYAGNLTYNGCTFNSKGKFLNIYRESATEYDIVAEGCVFNTSVKTNKAALNIKETCGTTFLKYNVTITDCSCNDLQNTLENTQTEILYRVSPIWQVDEMKEGDAAITVTVDGQKQFPATNFKVSTAEALKSAVKMTNAGKEAVKYTIELADGIYEVSDIAIAENVNNKTLDIKAANRGQVTLKMNADTKSKQIFLVDGYSGNHSSYRLVIDGIKFDLTAVTNGDAAPVYAFQADDSKAATIDYKTAGPNLRYAHDITIQNCELKGAAENAMMFYSQSNTSPNNIVVKDCSIANVGYLFSGYCDTFTASNVTATNVKHFVNNQGNGIIVEDCTVDCYTDYAIRANSGPVSITSSKFVMTYTETDKGGVYVDRGANTQLTMTGNTYPAKYAGAYMHDLYNEKGGECILNGSITLQNSEFYDFPRE